MLYLSLQPPNFKPPNLVFLSPALLETNLKLKLENTIKLFKTHSDYQQYKVLVVNNNSKEEKKRE